MKVSKEELKVILNKTINLSSKLIQFYPKYGSLGIINAQNYLKSHLENNDWSQVIFESYNAKNIKTHPSYVMVSDFCSIYSDYEKFEKYNLIGLIDSKKQGPVLILNGHIDVDIVDETISWHQKEEWNSGRVNEGKLFGRGATDMLCGLSSLIEVANYLNNNKHLWCGKIIFKSVMDEEIGGNGTLSSLINLKDKGWYNDEYIECIIAEPTDNKLCTISLGFLHLKFYFSGIPIHMGVARKNHNALNQAVDFIQLFETFLKSTLEKMKINHLINRFKYNFGVIKGGIDPAIPIEALELEATIFYPEDVKKVVFMQLLSTLISQHYNNSISIRESSFSFGGANFYNNIFGKSCKNGKNIFSSPCDARLYKEFNIPTTIFGPGSLTEAHSINEYIEIKSVAQYIEILLKHMLDYFRGENVR
ncbi:MAG: M20/M25/M40 family metallo-hydrolase [Candidatus Tisiphia sp.]